MTTANAACMHLWCRVSTQHHSCGDQQRPFQCSHLHALRHCCSPDAGPVHEFRHCFSLTLCRRSSCMASTSGPGGVCATSPDPAPAGYSATSETCGALPPSVANPQEPPWRPYAWLSCQNCCGTTHRSTPLPRGRVACLATTERETILPRMLSGCRMPLKGNTASDSADGAQFCTVVT